MTFFLIFAIMQAFGH